jgi:hypothetical protein
MEPCIDPTALTPEQLGAYATDPSDALPAVVLHVAACSACQREVADLSSFTTYLRGQLYRIDCPPSADLTAWAAGTLAPAVRASIDAHLPTCARCREELALETAALADHDPILDWAAPPVASAVRRVLATLLDALSSGGLAAPSPALNLRGAAADSTARPILYRAEDVTLALRVTPAPQGRYHIEGVISSATDPTLTLAELPVRLYAQGDATTPRLIAEDVTDGGTFLLGPFPSGRYELEVHLPDRIIAVEGLSW